MQGLSEWSELNDAEGLGDREIEGRKRQTEKDRAREEGT